MATPITYPVFKAFVQGTNAPLSGGLVYTYAAGTSTPLSTYSDAGLGTANANPTVLDANGEALMFPAVSTSYKFVIKNSDGVTQRTVDNVNYSGLQDSISGHNFLLDGGFEQWQESTSYTGASTLKVLDGWSVKIPTGTASNFTISRQASGRAGSQYCLRIQRTAAATDIGNVSLIQDLETADSLAIQDQPVVLSFRARCGATYSGGAINSFVLSGAGTDEAWRTSGGYTGQDTIGFAANTVTTSWQQFVVVNTATPSTTLSQVGVIPFYQIPFTGTAGASDYLDIDDVQLEFGTAASSFARVSTAELLRQGQRRYYKSFAAATMPAQNAGTVGAHYFLPQQVGASTASYEPRLPMPSNMRVVAGTVTLYNPSAANAQVRNATVAADCTASTAVTVAGNEAHVTFTTAGGSSVGDVNIVQYTIDKRI